MLNEKYSDLDPDEERDSEGDMIQTPFDPVTVDIYDRKMTIGTLLERLKHGELKLTPDFQRRANLWDTPRKSRLIESVLLRIPLPSFYFSEDNEGTYEVVDGLQRLCSIFHFLDYAALNISTSSKLNPLRLQGLQYLTEMEDLSFAELERPFQRRIKELEISVNVIRASTPKPVMFNVFARLNQGGLPLSAQEIRNAIFPGEWRTQVRELSQSKEFLDATEGRVPTDRQQDMEMVLRFIALWSLYPNFQRPADQVLDKFLNDTVEKRINHWGPPEWDNAREAFYKGLKRTVEVFDRHAFRKSHHNQQRSPINKGLFEAQTICLATLNEKEIKILLDKKDTLSEKFGVLMDNSRSRLSVVLRSGTGHADSSNTRIDEMMRIIIESLDHA